MSSVNSIGESPRLRFDEKIGYADLPHGDAIASNYSFYQLA
jgi:hypothetical protein